MKQTLLGIFTCALLCSCSHTASAPSAQLDNAEKTHFTVETLNYKTLPSRTLALDLYRPAAQSAAPAPLLIWIHGGAWLKGSKERTLPQNGNLITRLTAQGYAIAAVNYSLSGQAIFPAQIQDINDAVNFLVTHSEKLNIEATSVGIMGRSAGGHLAALLSTSNKNENTNFYVENHQPNYKVAVVVDFFGVSDFETLTGNSGLIDHDAPDAAEAKLLGASPRTRIDLAKWASPVTYINNNTPPFILLHGSDDKIIPASQSLWLKSKLDDANVPNQLIIAQGASHGDPVFDDAEYVEKVIDYVKKHLPVSQ